MASKRRLRRNRCDGKQPYPDKQAASEAWYAIRMKFGTFLMPYRCPFCRQWHLGNSRKVRL